MHWTDNDKICAVCPVRSEACLESRHAGMIYDEEKKEHFQCSRRRLVSGFRNKLARINYKHSLWLPAPENLNLEKLFQDIEKRGEAEIILNEKNGQVKIGYCDLMCLLKEKREKKVHLFGPVGSGKTTIAIALSLLMGKRFSFQCWSGKDFFKRIIQDDLARRVRRETQIILIDELFQEPEKMIYTSEEGWVTTPSPECWGIAFEEFLSTRWPGLDDGIADPLRGWPWLITTSLLSVEMAWADPGIRERYTASTFDRFREGLIEICVFREKSLRQE